MFGAGVGIGMLTYSTAEPIYHFANNPDVLLGAVKAQSIENVRPAFKWGLFHWGLTPWGIYAVLGIALAYFSYNKGLPLTIRSGLYPLFGKAIAGPLGNIVDIVAILATVIGVAVTIGFGVSQFASGVFNISGAQWLMDDNGSPSFIAQLLALAIVIIASTFSALSGLKKGIKWLSNINMGLTVFLLLFFVFFGAFAFALKSFGLAIWDYLLSVPAMSLTIWDSDSSPELAKWQSSWTIFYWAWWIAFAPFVGLFLARVSKGRTIREYVVGAMIVPSLTCLTWFALVGGTALDLELSGVANGQILNADISAQLYETINLILSPVMAKVMSLIIVILLLTYLITSVDSAILIVTTLAAVGNQQQCGHM
jgi:choline-glycine betaine transporter